MALDLGTESCDLSRKVDSNQENYKAQFNSNKKRQLPAAKSGTSDVGIDELMDRCITWKNVQFSRAPSKEICNLAVSTFEKMGLENLKTLEKLSNELKLKGHMNREDLKTFTMRIMAEVWECDKELTDLLIADPFLTETLGKELLVLFDNVMSDPIYETKEYGKPQRYTKACLDNSIQPIYEDNVPGNRWKTFETVISTYTSPTAFTPEMETLMRTAASLGISTNDLNLKSFVTERSLSAFLKTVIQAKLRKESFLKKFNSKLLGALHHSPNIVDKGLVDKLKYSFSKMYQFFEPKETTISENQEIPLRQNSASHVEKSRHSKRDSYSVEKAKDSFKTKQLSKRTKHATICKKCHEPFREIYTNEKGIVKSLSDMWLSMSSYDSITDCQCFDNAKKVWEKKVTSVKPILIPAQSPFKTDSKLSKGLYRKRSNLNFAYGGVAEISERESGFGLLTEQRSFFRLGEGALRDALSEYAITKTGSPMNASPKSLLKKKRVRWLDETSLSSIYGSLMDSFSDLKLVSKINSNPTIKISDGLMRKIIYILIDHIYPSGVVELADKPLNKVFTHAFLQATFVATIIWFFFILYELTPEIAEKLRHLPTASWLQIFNWNSVI